MYINGIIFNNLEIKIYHIIELNIAIVFLNFEKLDEINIHKLLVYNDTYFIVTFFINYFINSVFHCFIILLYNFV